MKQNEILFRGFIFTSKQSQKQKQLWRRVKFFLQIIDNVLNFLLFRVIEDQKANKLKEEKRLKLDASNTIISFKNTTNNFNIITSHKTHYFLANSEEQKQELLLKISKILYSPKIQSTLLPSEIILQEINLKKGITNTCWIEFITGKDFPKKRDTSDKNNTHHMVNFWLTNYRMIIQIPKNDSFHTETKGNFEIISIHLDSIFEVKVFAPEKSDNQNVNNDSNQNNNVQSSQNTRDFRKSLFLLNFEFYSSDIEILELQCRDFREIKLGFQKDDSLKRLFYLLENLTYQIKTVNHSSAFFAVSSIPSYFTSDNYYENNQDLNVQLEIKQENQLIQTNEKSSPIQSDIENVIINEEENTNNNNDVDNNNDENIIDNQINDNEVDNSSENSDNNEEKDLLNDDNINENNQYIEEIYNNNLQEFNPQNNSNQENIIQNNDHQININSLISSEKNRILFRFGKFCYNENRENNRMGISLQQWKFTSLLSSESKKSNPKENLQIRFGKQILIPFDINNKLLKRASKVREGGQFPVLTWGHPSKGSYLFIGLKTKEQTVVPQVNIVPSGNQGSPAVTSNLNIKKLSPEHWEADQKYIEILQTLCNSSQLHFADIGAQFRENRAKVNSTCPYPNCTLILLEQPTQNSLKNSLLNLYKKLTSSKINGMTCPEDFIDIFRESQWTSTSNTLTLNAICLARLLGYGESVVIESGPEDYYSVIQLSSLVQLIVDPYYRTLDGFVVLLQKEWFSYLIGTRENPTLMWELRKNDPFFAPFIQFLEIVWKLLQVFPHSFQFNSKLLLFLAEAINCGTLTFRICKYFNLSYPGFPVNILYFDPNQSNNKKLEDLLFGGMAPIWFLIAFYSNDFIINNEPLENININSFSTFTRMNNPWFPHFLKYTHWKSMEEVHKLMDAENVIINLPGIGLPDLPIEIIFLNYLKEINLSYNNLTTIPLYLDRLINLEVLSLEGNYISVISSPKNRKIFPEKLLIVNLNYNCILSISSCVFSQLSNVKELYLMGNGITKLKKSIRYLTSLEVLDINDNRLTSIPEEIGYLTNLTTLSITRNNLVQLPNSLVHLLNLEYLNLSRNDLLQTTSFTPQNLLNYNYFSPTNNKSNKSNNNNDHIPTFAKMKMLNISYNPRFDTCFYFNMTSLVELYLRGFHLSQLPKLITQLHSTLKLLDLQQNDFVNFPKEIITLTSLEILNLQSNQISYLPVHLSKLVHLTDLNLKGNLLTREGMYGIGALPAIKVLDLSKNPKNLLHSSSLLWANLGLLQNTLEKLRISSSKWVVGSKLKTFLKQQMDLANSNEKFSYLPKVIFVGPPSTGKSCLKKWLTYRYSKFFQYTKERSLENLTENATENSNPIPHFNRIAPTGCIDISYHTLNYASVVSTIDPNFSPTVQHHNQTIYFNIWDFGGDRTFIPAQQYFMSAACSHQSILLITFNWNERISKMGMIMELLNTIKFQKLIPNVYLVGTHVDILSRSNLYVAYTEKNDWLKHLRKSYLNLQNIFLICSSKKFLTKHINTPNLLVKKNINTEFPYNKSIDYILYQLFELEIEIFRELKNDSVPFSFFDLISLIDNERKRFSYQMMSWREFCDISKACFISEEKKRKVVFDLLNFGSLIQFGIQNQHFYSPQFIADLLESFYPSSISHYNPPKGGGLTEEIVNHIWIQKFPKDMHFSLLQILQNYFDFVCILNNSKLQNNNITNDFNIIMMDGVTPSALGIKREFLYSVAPRDRYKSTKSLLAIIPQNTHPNRPSKFLSEKFEHINLLKINKEVSIYHIPFIPILFFSQILVNLLPQVTAEMMWQKGLFCKKGNEMALVEIFDTVEEVKQFLPKLSKHKFDFREGYICIVYFFPTGEDTFHLREFILECMEKIREKWYSLQICKV